MKAKYKTKKTVKITLSEHEAQVLATLLMETDWERFEHGDQYIFLDTLYTHLWHTYN